MKKSKFRLYRDKFRKLNGEERIYVRRIAALFVGIMILVITALSTGIYFTFHHFHMLHGDSDKIKGKAEFETYVQKKEKAINLADENKQAQSPTEEALLLAHLVTAEVGESSREAQIAVASVVMNRVESSLFPNTIHDVIYQDGQYECVNNGAIEKDLIESATESAYYVYQNGSQIPCNVVWQAEFVQGSGVWALIDGEYFCYE